MTDVERLLQRQAAWQKSRAQLTWPEKIRIAEQMRDSLRQWRVEPQARTVTQPVKAGTAQERKQRQTGREDDR